MGIQSRAQDIIIVQLPPEPHTAVELEMAAKIASKRSTCYVIVILDFLRVGNVTCLTLCQLMKTWKTVANLGHNLILCNLASLTRGIILSNGFDVVFDMAHKTSVVFEPSTETEESGNVTIECHQFNGRPERRKYVRLQVSGQQRINVVLTHVNCQSPNEPTELCNSIQANLVDISEGGAQLSIDAEVAQKLQKGQLIHIQLTAPNTKTQETLGAWIREILPTADEKNICLGLEFDGIEANPIGRSILQEFCESVGQYYQTELVTT